MLLRYKHICVLILKGGTITETSWNNLQEINLLGSALKATRNSQVYQFNMTYTLGSVLDLFEMLQIYWCFKWKSITFAEMKSN